MAEPWETVVIGAGPAGAAAAMQLHRSGIRVLVLEAERVGGLLHEANLVENYPGAGRALSGAVLAGRLAVQMRTLGIPVRREHVRTVTPHEQRAARWLITTAAQTYAARWVVAAPGTTPLPPTDVDIAPAAQPLVSSEVRSLLDLRGRRIAIVGAGDAAFDYALNLAARGNQVVIMNRGRTVRALALLVDRCRRNPHIAYRRHTAVQAVAATGDSLVLRITQQTADYENSCGQPPRETTANERFDRLVFAIGRTPATSFLPAEDMAPAAAAGLFVVGDAVNGRQRQAVIAAGDGLRVAMQIPQQITETKREDSFARQ